MNSSLGSINGLEWLTEVFGLLDYLFITGEYNWGTAWWKSCMERGIRGRGAELPCSLQGYHSEALQTLPFWGFIGASLHRHDWLKHSPLATDSTSSPSFLPRNRGETESSSPLITWLATSNQLLIYNFYYKLQHDAPVHTSATQREFQPLGSAPPMSFLRDSLIHLSLLSSCIKW